MGASPSPCCGFCHGLLGAVSGASPITVVSGLSEGANGGGALGIMGACSWLPLSFLILLPHRDPSLLLMLSQENKTKHLNVCLVQHRLEEGSEVV
jgi:hypothetical protein